LYLVPEGARLPRAAVVRSRLADEVEPIGRAGGRRVEEIAVARDRVGPREPGAAETFVELAPGLVVEERRDLRAAREAPFLEPEHEQGLVPARARTQEVDDVHAAGLTRPAAANLNSVDPAGHLLRRDGAAQAP